jgi:hypothetical protein
MVKKLTNVLHGQRMATPPPCLLSLRDQFCDQAVVLKRAYYGLGNYIAAREAERVTQTCPVIMDRLVAPTSFIMPTLTVDCPSSVIIL